jgi:phenylalanyl-tRNA synthetase beta chain
MGFFDLKGVVEALLSRHGLVDATWGPGAHPAMHPGRTAVLRLGEAECGYVGELHPLVRANFDLPDLPVAVMELNLGVLMGSWGGAQEMQPISVQPAVYEDLVILVDEGIAADMVLKLIRQAGGRLRVDAQLLDVYRGLPIPPGSKSLAFALTFQADDRTLTDDDVQKLRAKIVSRLGRDLGATLRS